MGLFQGLAGNLTEVTNEELIKEFGNYLINDEEVEVGYKLVRDVVIFTSRRLLHIDKQGATGKKTKVMSYNLNSLCEVSAETAGFGIDDSELILAFIKQPYTKCNGVTYIVLKYEFPKKYDITKLYKMLQNKAYDNYDRLNAIDRTTVEVEA